MGGLIECPPYQKGPGSVFCEESTVPFSPLLLAGNAIQTHKHHLVKVHIYSLIAGYLGKFPIVYSPHYDHRLSLFLHCLKSEKDCISLDCGKGTLRHALSINVQTRGSVWDNPILEISLD